MIIKFNITTLEVTNVNYSYPAVPLAPINRCYQSMLFSNSAALIRSNLRIIYGQDYIDTTD